MLTYLFLFLILWIRLFFLFLFFFLPFFFLFGIRLILCVFVFLFLSLFSGIRIFFFLSQVFLNNSKHLVKGPNTSLASKKELCRVLTCRKKHPHHNSKLHSAYTRNISRSAGNASQYSITLRNRKHNKLS